MLTLLIFVPLLIFSIALWVYDYTKYRKAKEIAENTKNPRWDYDNYFDYLYYKGWSWRNIVAVVIFGVSLFVLCIDVPLIVDTRNNVRLEYESAITMRDSYAEVAEQNPFAYANAINFNEMVADNRACQDNFLQGIYYPDDCDWNNIELIDIKETLKEDYDWLNNLFK